MGIINLTNKKGVSSIKGFVVSQTPYDGCIESSTSDYTLTLYHTGAGIAPALGDTIYKNSVATELYTSADNAIDRHVQSSGQHLRVDANGISITPIC